MIHLIAALIITVPVTELAVVQIRALVIVDGLDLNLAMSILVKVQEIVLLHLAECVQVRILAHAMVDILDLAAIHLIALR